MEDCRACGGMDEDNCPNCKREKLRRSLNTSDLRSLQARSADATQARPARVHADQKFTAKKSNPNAHGQLAAKLRAKVLSCVFTKEHVRSHQKTNGLICEVCHARLAESMSERTIRNHVRTCCEAARAMGKRGCTICAATKKRKMPTQIQKGQVKRETTGKPVVVVIEPNGIYQKTEKDRYNDALRVARGIVERARRTILSRHSSVRGKQPGLRSNADRLDQTDGQRDGSAGYHDFAREHGRYGSHSSYDNMDDESSAD